MGERPLRVRYGNYQYTRWRQSVYDSSQWQLVGGPTPKQYTSYLERILSNDNPRGKRKPKFCLHSQYTRLTQPTRFVFTIPGGAYPNRYMELTSILVDPTVLFALAFQEASIPPPDWDAAIERVIPSFRNDFNLINFALEAGDLPDLARSVASRLRRGYTSRQDISDDYLAAQFGALPLISDFRAVMDRLSNWGENLGRARARLAAGVRASGGGTYPVSFLKTGYSVSAPNATVLGDLAFSGKITTHYSCKITGHINSNSLQEFLDYIGFYPDISTLWDALPFSFLVDYFLPIGDSLQQRSWVQPSINCVNGCVSYKLEGTYDFKPRSYIVEGKAVIIDPGSSTAFQSTFSNGTIKRYLRYPVTVNYGLGSGQLGLRRPGIRQQANIAALLASRR